MTAADEGDAKAETDAADDGNDAVSSPLSGGERGEAMRSAESAAPSSSSQPDDIKETQNASQDTDKGNMNNHGDTATSPESVYSGDDDNGDEGSCWTDDGDDYDDSSYDAREMDEMPLLKYGRIVGSLPRLMATDTGPTSTTATAAADAGAGPGTGASGSVGAADTPHDDSAPNNTSDESPPAPLAVPVTCQCMGRVVLGPGARVYSSDAAPSVAASQAEASSGGALPGMPSAASDRARTSSTATKADDVTAKIRHVLALGFADGTVRVVDPITGMDIVPLGKLAVPGAGIGDILNRGSPAVGTRGAVSDNVDTSRRIVGIAFDASGTFLAAINANGDAAVFELKYIAGDARSVAAAAAQGESGTTKEDHIANLLSVWTQQQPSPQKQDGADPTPPAASTTVDDSEQLLQNLTVALPIPTSRFAYPRSTHSVPTCLAIDPTYRRRREKSVLVGFADGRLILTKRGMLFSRRSDSVIYQGVGGPSKSGTQGGIEAVTWRGSLVAWADESGIKLFDIDDMIRIAHVDRPSGARASLYPTISSLRPVLLFERPYSLLIAWGDCIMSMHIKERAARSGATGSAATAAGGTGSAPGSPKVTKRRTVECSVAWELDCVVCGAVPLDGKHWAVLGLVPKPPVEDDNDDSDEALPHNNLPTSYAGNLVELQIISRMAGTVVAADALPLLASPQKSSTSAADAGLEFSLISSYCTPRMDEVLEVEEEELNGSVEDHAAQVAMFEALNGGALGGDGSGSSQQHMFLDPHLKFSVDTIRFNSNELPDIVTNTEETKTENGGEDANTDNEASSVYSDDYKFLFRPEHASSQPGAVVPVTPQLPVEPPTMIVSSSRDLVLARTRDIDDAVAHARSAGMHGKALQIALRDTRMVRRHDLNRLIDEYLSSLLRLQFPATYPAPPLSVNSQENQPLTISRLRLAAKSTPRLLGGHVEMWRKWIKEFSQVPGGLFVLREYLPVRDPKLPAKVYEMVLVQMLSELETMLSASDRSGSEATSVVHQDAADLFLKTLRCWGPTSSISERIKVHRMFTTMQVWNERGVTSSAEIEEAKEALYNRRHQTVVGYLQTDAASSVEMGAAKHALDKSLDGASSLVSSTDSLFSIEHVRDLLEDRLHQYLHGDAAEEGPQTLASTSTTALAELSIMKGDQIESLKLQLAIGARYPTVDISDLENEAIRSVNATNTVVDGTTKVVAAKAPIRSLPYHRVLGYIEYHHLHWCLLDTQFLSFENNHTDKSPHPPVLALISLVGLKLSGCFLVDHCSLPRSTNAASLRQPHSHHVHRAQTLPLDLVAQQFSATPKLLHRYLTQVYLHRPEVYVEFPNTAVPPRAVTDLHRTHLELHIKYAVDTADKKRELSDIPSYDDVDAETPLLAFLKAALPHGGTRPDDIRRMLEVCREGRTNAASPRSPGMNEVRHPHLFARELAYVIEHCGSGKKEDARIILQLYLEGAKSLPLAVGYAQRNKAHSAMLWDSLISYCLDPKPQLTRPRGKGKRKGSIDKKEDGSLFGALLEVAARSGADLAHLVAKIPNGMQIEGLRPRLIAAISDYKVKVQMHEAAVRVLNKDKIDLIRELSHKSRRGVRIILNEGDADPSTRTAEAMGSISARSFPVSAPTRTSKIHAISLMEKKGERLYVHHEKTGVLRSKSLAIR